MAGLLDFLQSASNTAADTVAAPVDLLAWALRKAGVPVPQNAIGGTQWMTERGLRRDVQQSPASLAGETVGLLSPMVAAAKAPQIAKGLLQVEANAMAPTTLRPEAGAIVWQGSPHKYDAEKLVRLPSGEQVYVGGKFNEVKDVPSGATVLQDFPLGRIRSEAIGTGEGSQAYGHGSYLADNPTVANSYRAMAGNPGRRQAGLSGAGADQVVLDSTIQLTAKQFTGGDVGKLAELIQRKPGAFTNPEGLLKRIAEYEGNSPPSFIYKVDLPDEKIARMLDWDKPLNQQSDAVYNAMRKLYMDKTVSAPTTGPTGAAVLQAQQALGRQGATEYFRNAGIPGIRFLDGGSRGTGQGTSNFVVFPGEENALRILERNGLLAP